MNGFDNEYQFVIELNNKKVGELNILLKELVYKIFNNINDNDIVKAWRNHYKQKTDIMIKVGTAIKGISIKMGTRNSVHAEYLDKFIQFLKCNNIKEEIIEKYLLFHYGDGTINGKGQIRISSSEYKVNHQKEIDEINIAFNNNLIIKNAIKRFVTLGNNSNYEIDALVYGTPTDFFFLLPSEIEQIHLNNNVYCSSPHFGKLICQPMDRCINRNPKYENCRDIVQIKWYNLLDDIISYKNSRV